MKQLLAINHQIDLSKVGIVDLGSLSWVYTGSGNYTRMTATLSGIKTFLASEVANIICPKYISTTDDDVYLHTTDKTIGSHNGVVQVYDSSYTDAATFKTAMSGVYLAYEKN